jgi:hypothetical protein
MQSSIKIDGVVDGPVGPVDTERGRRFTMAYLLAVIGGAFATLCFFWFGLVILDHSNVLPPPQLANNLCVDEKLHYLRDTPINPPDVLAVGSSVTWRAFDGDSVTAATGGRAVTLNGAFCGLKLNQTVFTARYYLERYPHIRDVITIIAPQDAAECSKTDPHVFNATDVDRYVYSGAWSFPFYLKYFDPFTFIKNVAILSNLKGGELPFDVMKFDRYGGALLDTRLSQPDLVYRGLPPLDPACFSALRELARELSDAGKRLIVVTMPLHPNWIEKYDPRHTVLTELAANIRSTLAGTSAVFWNADKSFAMAPDSFIDAIHIRRSAAQNFSRVLVSETGLGQVAGHATRK